MINETNFFEEQIVKQVKKFYPYMGSKARHLSLLNNIINRINIDYSKFDYIEPFIGSGIVLLNLEKDFKSYWVNDWQREMILPFLTCKKLTDDFILSTIKEVEKTYKIEVNKEDFYLFRDNVYNKEKDDNLKTVYSFMLFCTTINNMVRFGKNGYNTAFGNRLYSNKINNFIESINYCKTKDIKATNLCFTEMSKDFRDRKDIFLMLDPPYMNTDASYRNDSNVVKVIINYLIEKKPYFIYTDLENEYNEKLKDYFDFEYIKVLRNISPNLYLSIEESLKLLIVLLNYYYLIAIQFLVLAKN